MRYRKQVLPKEVHVLSKQHPIVLLVLHKSAIYFGYCGRGTDLRDWVIPEKDDCRNAVGRSLGEKPSTCRLFTSKSD